MAGIGKRLSGLIGAEKMEGIKQLGIDTIGDLIGNHLSESTSSEPKSQISPPPTGKRVMDVEPPKSDPPVSKNVASDLIDEMGVVATAGTKPVADKIIELNELRVKGLISDAEFGSLKNELLGS